MAVINLEFRKHWFFDLDDNHWIPEKARLNPDIHRWMSQHKVSHQLIYHEKYVHYISGVCILNSNHAMLFKLTWM